MKAGATDEPGPHGLGVPIRSTQSPRRVDWDEYEFGNRVSGGNGGQEVGRRRVVRSADVFKRAQMMGWVGDCAARERASVHTSKVIKLEDRWRLCSSCKQVSGRVCTPSRYSSSRINQRASGEIELVLRSNAVVSNHCAESVGGSVGSSRVPRCASERYKLDQTEDSGVGPLHSFCKRVGAHAVAARRGRQCMHGWPTGGSC
jgi:hypothetical protein